MGSLPERKTSHIVLIPWDPESKEHCERLHFQRIACGWGAEDVGKWQAKQNEGKMNLHWVVCSISFCCITVKRLRDWELSSQDYPKV